MPSSQNWNESQTFQYHDASDAASSVVSDYITADISGHSIGSYTDAPPNTSTVNGPKRRGRHRVSCAECRRRKLKCNRSVPCSNCIKRDCADICPAGTLSRETKETASYERRIRHLEYLLKERAETDPTDKRISWTEPRRPQDQSYYVHQRVSHDVPRAGASVQEDGTTDLSEKTMVHNEYQVAANVTSSLDVDTRPPPVNLQKPSVDEGTHLHHTIHHMPHSEDMSRLHATNRAMDEQVCGTLLVDENGRSRYLGTRAGTEWLQNQERPGFSRAVSEAEIEASPHSTAGFPFGPIPTGLSKTELFSRLPAKEETSVLVEAYFRSFAWNLNTITRPAFNSLFDMVYNTKELGNTATRVHVHQLSLLFAVFAMGAHHCLEYPPNDPIVEEYISLAKSGLAVGDFLVKNTIPGLQALTLIGHLSTETERGRRGELAWPLYGLAMRLVQAMGIHRDGSKWNLPTRVVEERRLVFWECYTIDIFQAHCFSRPPLMRANHFDTQLPSVIFDSFCVSPDGTSDLPKTFKGMKYEVVKIFARLLDLAMDISPPSYDNVITQYEQLCAFERSIPYHLRCRNALIATISRYTTPEAAACDSPPINRRDLKRTFEQFTLALHVSEAILFLQRPYFVKAMKENSADPVQSQYGASLLAVVERCNVVTQIVHGLTELYPAVASRHWFYWYHLFNAAICVGTLVLRCPQSPLAPLAMTILDESISAYSVGTRQNSSSTLNSNLDQLLSLRQRSNAKMSQDSSGLSKNHLNDIPGIQVGEKTNENIDEELLGWETRLVERGAKKATTIVSHHNQRLSISAEVEAMAHVVDSTPPFLSAMSVDNQLPSADIMMHQHFSWCSDIDGILGGNDGTVT